MRAEEVDNEIVSEIRVDLLDLFDQISLLVVHCEASSHHICLWLESYLLSEILRGCHVALVEVVVVLQIFLQVAQEIFTRLVWRVEPYFNSLPVWRIHVHHEVFLVVVDMIVSDFEAVEVLIDHFVISCLFSSGNFYLYREEVHTISRG